MDAKTEELRAAHDLLAELYADRLADALDHLPADRAMLGLFCDLTLAAGLGTAVGDIGCGTGRLEPYLAAKGLSPRGIDLSSQMIRVVRRDHHSFGFGVVDLRELPFQDASLAGVVCWYSLMYLAPADRPAAFSELARVVKPGGYLVTAFKAGDRPGPARGPQRRPRRRIRRLLAVPGRDGMPGNRRRLRDRVLGRTSRRGTGGFPTGVPARAEILMPIRSSSADTLNPAGKGGQLSAALRQIK
jgi:SAM-dependent methyltransferase